MLKNYFFLLLALVGGVAGAFTRSKMVASYSSTDLPIPTTASAVAMTVVCVLVFALLGGLAYAMHRGGGTTPVNTAHNVPVIPLVIGSVGALLALFATYRFFTQTRADALEAQMTAQLSGKSYRPDILAYLFIGLLCLAVFAMLLSSLRRCSARSPMHDSLLLLLPGVASCLWLMLTYRHLAGYPFVSTYIFLLFSMLFGMLAHYFIAANSFQGDSRPLLCLTAGMAIFFSIISIRYDMLTPNNLLCAAQIFYFSAILLLIARNDPSVQPIADQPLPVNAQKEEVPE